MSDEPAATDRGMWRVVASRDFWVRLHDKGFVISTSITLAVLTIFILIRAYGGGPTRSRWASWATTTSAGGCPRWVNEAGST